MHNEFAPPPAGGPEDQVGKVVARCFVRGKCQLQCGCPAAPLFGDQPKRYRVVPYLEMALAELPRDSMGGLDVSSDAAAAAIEAVKNQGKK